MLFYDRKELKLHAKASLRGIQPRPWKVTLLFWLLATLLPGIVTGVIELLNSGGIFAYLGDFLADPMGWSARFESMDVEEALGYYQSFFAPVAGLGLIATFVNVLVSLYQIVMNYGYTNYGLKLYQGQPTEKKDIFSGFPLAGRAIVTSIVTGVFTFLWSLLLAVLVVCAGLILMVVCAAADSEALLVISLILIYVAVLVAVLFISYRYVLAPYFVLTADMGTMDAIRASKNAMRGNYGRRFMLDLSFLGWELLEALIGIVIILVGIFATFTVVSFSVAMSGVPIEYVEDGVLATQFMVGYLISAAVAALAMVPLSLWLTPYKKSAEAGFFLAATAPEIAPGPSVPWDTGEPPVPPRPTQPSGMWDNVPQPPAFTSPEPPAAPEPPVDVPVDTSAEPEPSIPPEPTAEAPAEPAVDVSDEPQPPVDAPAPEEPQ